jgi:hypothetical protein
MAATPAQAARPAGGTGAAGAAAAARARARAPGRRRAACPRAPHPPRPRSRRSIRKRRRVPAPRTPHTPLKSTAPPPHTSAPRPSLPAPPARTPDDRLFRAHPSHAGVGMPAPCPTCEQAKKAFLCCSCINSQLFDTKKSELKQQRDELQAQLEAALEKRVRRRASGTRARAPLRRARAARLERARAAHLAVWNAARGSGACAAHRGAGIPMRRAGAPRSQARPRTRIDTAAS